MAFKFICFFALLASTQAGILSSHQAYSDAPSVSYSSVSTPQAYGAPAYANVAAPVAYAAPSIKVNAPLSYAAPVSYAAPAYNTQVYKKSYVSEDYSTPAHYNFGYAIADPHTGDVKSQQETREGDVVKGSYSLIEADGTKRIVEYTVDAHSGFNAVVHREPATHNVRPVTAPISYGQPAYKVASPLSYSAPAAYSQPAFKVSAPFAYAQPALKAYHAPIVTKVPALTNVAYSSAPQVSYSSVSSPVHQQTAPSYYH